VDTKESSRPALACTHMRGRACAGSVAATHIHTGRCRLLSRTGYGAHVWAVGWTYQMRLGSRVQGLRSSSCRLRPPHTECQAYWDASTVQFAHTAAAPAGRASQWGASGVRTWGNCTVVHAVEPCLSG